VRRWQGVCNATCAATAGTGVTVTAITDSIPWGALAAVGAYLASLCVLLILLSWVWSREE